MGTPPRGRSQIAQPATAAILVVVVLLVTGCAGLSERVSVIRPTQVVDCPGVVRDLPVLVEVASDSPWRQDIVTRLTAEAECRTAEYDPVTEQGRWAYRVTLKNDDRGLPTYTFHLTTLERRITNGLDRVIRDDVPTVAVQEFTLDWLRADLKLPPGRHSFPCVEQIGPPGPRLRTRSGLMVVHRRYAGDVKVSKNGRDIDAFVPVRIGFDVGFMLPPPGSTLPDDSEREQARRIPEWALLGDQCETCRPLVMCESLAGKPVQLDPDATDLPPYVVNTPAAVHVMTGLPRRPVIVDPVLTQRKRTAVCTRWSPQGDTPGQPFLIPTDSSDSGISPATPYLTFHHAAGRCPPQQALGCLTPGRWAVEILTGEILDDWSNLVPVTTTTAAASPQAPQRMLREACLGENNKPLFRREIKVE